MVIYCYKNELDVVGGGTFDMMSAVYSVSILFFFFFMALTILIIHLFLHFFFSVAIGKVNEGYVHALSDPDVLLSV